MPCKTVHWSVLLLWLVFIFFVVLGGGYSVPMQAAVYPHHHQHQQQQQQRMMGSPYSHYPPAQGQSPLQTSPHPPSMHLYPNMPLGPVSPQGANGMPSPGGHTMLPPGALGHTALPGMRHPRGKGVGVDAVSALEGPPRSSWPLLSVLFRSLTPSGVFLHANQAWVCFADSCFVMWDVCRMLSIFLAWLLCLLQQNATAY